jgi:hypothetical protein
VVKAIFASKSKIVLKNPTAENSDQWTVSFLDKSNLYNDYALLLLLYETAS